MIVSDQHKMLFVHVQKTGGITIEDVLTESFADARSVRGLPGERHATLAELLEARPKYEDYWSFGFVRNPWARMHSWYRMIQRRGKTAARKGTPELVDKNDLWRTVLDGYDSFEAFIMEATDELAQLRQPQVDYLTFGDRRVDFVGRTESLESDLASVLEHFGLQPHEVPHKNKAPTGEAELEDPRDLYRGVYTPAMRDRVATLFAKDLDEFGYEF